MIVLLVAQEIPEFDPDEGERATGNFEDVENGKGANRTEREAKMMTMYTDDTLLGDYFGGKS